MTDFDYENKQKKDIARGAFHKKGGSKSRKCTMPSDYLTPAQKQALNGPVTTILLNQPMDWNTFKSLSDTLKVKYIKNLQETYSASNQMLAKMFGCTGSTVGRALECIGLYPLRGTQGSTPEKTRILAAWDAFCNGVVGGGDNVQTEEPKQDEPHVTCYDIEAEELERAKLAAAMVQAEEDIAKNSEVYSARTEEPDEFTGDEVAKMTRDMAKTVEELNKMIEEYEDDCKGCHCSAEPVNEYQKARLHKMQVNLEGEYTDVADQIAMIAAMFGGRIKVRMEILADEVAG